MLIYKDFKSLNVTFYMLHLTTYHFNATRKIVYTAE
jgi:hypothetical protein